MLLPRESKPKTIANMARLLWQIVIGVKSKVSIREHMTKRPFRVGIFRIKSNRIRSLEKKLKTSYIF
jgi:hypothetical protein